tara:strand:+ start:143 stop:814 length:672 start_codon:yes stop_codon:yes gene_type:complete
MAIINNHSSINLDAGFQGDHSKLLQFFFNQGLNVEISDNVADLKTFLESLSDEEYPYNFDAAFNESFIDKEGFVLYLKNGDTIVSTYAAKGFDKNVFVEGMKEIYEGTYESVDIGLDRACYSSCQWVAKSHRGKKFGMCLDHLKKNIIFDKTNYGINYAIHKESFKDYHINGLHYSNSEKLATIPNGDVGGAGEAIDKVYNIAWVSKDEWSNKQSEVRALYTS